MFVYTTTIKKAYELKRRRQNPQMSDSSKGGKWEGRVTSQKGYLFIRIRD